MKWSEEEDEILLEIAGDDTKTVKKITNQYNRRTRLKYPARTISQIQHRIAMFRRKHLIRRRK